MEGTFCYFENSHYYIERVGESYSIGIEFPTFKTKLLMNEQIRHTAILLELNEENLHNLLNSFSEFKNINYENLDLYNYIICKSKIIKIDNWKDVFTFVKNKLNEE